MYPSLVMRLREGLLHQARGGARPSDLYHPPCRLYDQAT